MGIWGKSPILTLRRRALILLSKSIFALSNFWNVNVFQELMNQYQASWYLFERISHGEANKYGHEKKMLNFYIFWDILDLSSAHVYRMVSDNWWCRNWGSRLWIHFIRWLCLAVQIRKQCVFLVPRTPAFTVYGYAFSSVIYDVLRQHKNVGVLPCYGRHALIHYGGVYWLC